MRGQVTGWGFRGRAALGVVLLALSVTAVLAPAAGAKGIVFPAPNNAIDGVNQELQDGAQAMSRVLAKKLGFPLHLRIEIGWARFQKLVPNALTGTNESLNGPIDHSGAVCQIAVNRGFYESIRGADEKDEVLLHEDFHCYEYDVTPAAHTENDWILEGLARWADLTVFPDTHLTLALKALTQYYSTPQTSLFARSRDVSGGYDSVGFWAHVQDATGEMWQRVRDVVLAGVHGNDQAALDAALPAASQTSFLQSWGSSAFDLGSGPTPDWRMKSPLGSRYFASPHEPTLVDSSGSFSLAPWSTDQLSIAPSTTGPLIKIHLDQSTHARFGVSENYVDSDITSKNFCTAANPAQCQCPAEWSGSVPNVTPLPKDPDLGAASDNIGGDVSVTYQTPEDSGYCQPPKPVTCGTSLTRDAPLGADYCETLMAPLSCKNLLPGFNPTIEGEFRSLLAKWAGEPPPEEHEEDGNYNSLCFFEGYKGGISEIDKEKVFVGVIATGTFTERTTSEALAAQDFAIRAAAIAGSSSAGVGAESKISSTPEEENAHGFKECGSEGVVRVENLIAGFAIAGIAPEACGADAQALLKAVAGKL